MEKKIIKHKGWYIVIYKEENETFTGNITSRNSTGMLSTSYAATFPNNSTYEECYEKCAKYIEQELNCKQEVKEYSIADLNHIVINSAMTISALSIDNEEIQKECGKIIETVRNLKK